VLHFDGRAAMSLGEAVPDGSERGSAATGTADMDPEP
jgi:hypothetical protein